MSTLTQNFGLVKDSENEYYNIDKFNHNLDIIDQNMAKLVSGDVITETYAELVILKANNAIKPGQLYLLSDYATKYRQPVSNVIKTSQVEPLILQGIGTNQFAEIAYSPNYPQDIIYYDFNDNICEDGTTLRTGFIERRIDTVKKVDVPHDWRTMLWARYKATAAKWTSGAVTRLNAYQDNAGNLYVCIKSGTPVSQTDSNYFMALGYTVNDYIWPLAILTGLTLGSYADRFTFNQSDDLTKSTPTNFIISPECVSVKSGAEKRELNVQTLSSNVFVYSDDTNSPSRISIDDGSYNNTFIKNYSLALDPSCYNNVFGAGFSRSSIGADANNNIIGNGCHTTTFLTNCNVNVIGDNCINNTLGTANSYIILNSGCSFNTFGSNNYSNTFGNTCTSNTFGSNFYGNSFGNVCAGNTFGANCYNNTFADNCVANTFGSKCSNNTFGSGCSNNSFGSNCYSNLFGSACTSNTINSSCYNNSVGDSYYNNTIDSACSGNIFGSNCSSNNIGGYCTGNTFADYFRYNTLKPFIRNKNMTSLTELYSKNYNHEIFINTSLNVYTIHYVGTTPTYIQIP